MDFSPWNCKKHGDYTSANCPQCERSRRRAEARKRPKTPTFRVWIEQVNQTYVDVRANSVAEAKSKACRKWRREYADPSISDIEKVPV